MSPEYRDRPQKYKIHLAQIHHDNQIKALQLENENSRRYAVSEESKKLNSAYLNSPKVESKSYNTNLTDAFLNSANVESKSFSKHNNAYFNSPNPHLHHKMFNTANTNSKLGKPCAMLGNQNDISQKFSNYIQNKYYNKSNNELLDRKKYSDLDKKLSNFVFNNDVTSQNNRLPTQNRVPTHYSNEATSLSNAVLSNAILSNAVLSTTPTIKKEIFDFDEPTSFMPQCENFTCNRKSCYNPKPGMRMYSSYGKKTPVTTNQQEDFKDSRLANSIVQDFAKDLRIPNNTRRLFEDIFSEDGKQMELPQLIPINVKQEPPSTDTSSYPRATQRGNTSQTSSKKCKLSIKKEPGYPDTGESINTNNAMSEKK